MLTVLLWVLAAVLLAPAVIFSAQCLAALLPRRRPRRRRRRGENAPDADARIVAATDAAALRPRIAVLLPAHNEQETLGGALESLKPQLRDGDRVVVVADNCDDATAEVARQRGATVIERIDPDRRGKGYALSHGLTALAGEPFDVLVIVDADSHVEAGAIDALSRQVMQTGKPAQAVYLMEPCEQPTARDRVSSWAFMVKNLVRPLGLSQVGLPVQLTGTGMALPRAALDTTRFDEGNIVEDMQLGLDLALAGRAPRLCPEARVTGRFPRDQRDALGQRRRWEHGHLRTIIAQVPRLLWLGALRGRLGAVALALDLLVPPFSLLLVLLIVASLAVAAAALLLKLTWTPALILSWSTLGVLGCVFLAWLKFGRQTLPASSLLAATSYVAWKLPMYVMFFIRPEKRWIRTARSSAINSEAAKSAA